MVVEFCCRRDARSFPPPAANTRRSLSHALFHGASLARLAEKVVAEARVCTADQSLPGGYADEFEFDDGDARRATAPQVQSPVAPEFNVARFSTGSLMREAIESAQSGACLSRSPAFTRRAPAYRFHYIATSPPIDRGLIACHTRVATSIRITPHANVSSSLLTRYYRHIPADIRF